MSPSYSSSCISEFFDAREYNTENEEEDSSEEDEDEYDEDVISEEGGFSSEDEQVKKLFRLEVRPDSDSAAQIAPRCRFWRL